MTLTCGLACVVSGLGQDVFAVANILRQQVVPALSLLQTHDMCQTFISTQQTQLQATEIYAHQMALEL